MTKSDQSKQKDSSQDSPKIRKVILNDLRQGGIPRTLWQDLKDIYHFYLDYETKERLSRMSAVKRWFFLVFWIIKSLILKLSSTRRILLVIAIVLFFIGRNQIQIEGSNITIENFMQFGFIILLIILMLELKDKLLAQDELAVGRAVQRTFIPEQNPVLAGWEIWLYTQPANEVSGDLVDYLKFDDHKIHLALADVAGKGLGAALMMAKLQATLRALAPNFKSLAELGAQVNEILCRDGLPTRFVSLVYLELSADSNSIRILNAGHMPPIHIRSDKIEEMSKGNPALGLSFQSNYNEKRIKLGRGETLFIYSDGVSEAQNEADKFFGIQRLMNALEKLKDLPADQIGNAIVKTVENFMGAARRHDDISLIVLRRAN